MSTEMTDDRTHTLDVRDIDGEPFGDIMAALDALDEDETLVLVNSFEPTPLYDVLARRGFTHDTTQVEDAWHITVTHD